MLGQGVGERACRAQAGRPCLPHNASGGACMKEAGGAAAQSVLAGAFPLGPWRCRLPQNERGVAALRRPGRGRRTSGWAPIIIISSPLPRAPRPNDLHAIIFGRLDNLAVKRNGRLAGQRRLASQTAWLPASAAADGISGAHGMKERAGDDAPPTKGRGTSGRVLLLLLSPSPVAEEGTSPQIHHAKCCHTHTFTRRRSRPHLSRRCAYLGWGRDGTHGGGARRFNQSESRKRVAGQGRGKERPFCRRIERWRRAASGSAVPVCQPGPGPPPPCPGGV